MEGKNEEMINLTERKYYSALAMQAMISNPNIKRPQEGENLESDLEDFAGIAVQYADGLIKALNEKP